MDVRPRRLVNNWLFSLVTLWSAWGRINTMLANYELSGSFETLTVNDEMVFEARRQWQILIIFLNHWIRRGDHVSGHGSQLNAQRCDIRHLKVMWDFKLAAIYYWDLWSWPWHAVHYHLWEHCATPDLQSNKRRLHLPALFQTMQVSIPLLIWGPCKGCIFLPYSLKSVAILPL